MTDSAADASTTAQEVASRLVRILRILQLVQAGEAAGPGPLAERFEVGERTIYRDLDMLKRSGYRIVHDRSRGRYVLDEAALLPPVQLDLEEALAVAVLVQDAARTREDHLVEAAAAALRKLRSVMPTELREDVDAALDGLDVLPPPRADAAGTETFHRRVLRAIRSRRALACAYEKAGADAEEAFDLEPWQMFFARGAWYVVGLRSDRDAPRTMKLVRFTRLDPTHRPYEIPDGFTLEDHLGNAWIMRRDEPDVRVRLRFTTRFADLVEETRYHATQETSREPDGSLLFECTVAGTEEIRWWILGMGPEVEVLEPASLRAELHDLATRTEARYARGS